MTLTSLSLNANALLFAMALFASAPPAHAQADSMTLAALAVGAQARWEEGPDAVKACDAKIGPAPKGFVAQSKWAESVEACLTIRERNASRSFARAAVALALRNTAEEQVPRGQALYWREAGSARAELFLLEATIASEVAHFGSWLETANGTPRPSLRIPYETLIQADDAHRAWYGAWNAYSERLIEAAILACGFRDAISTLDGDAFLPPFQRILEGASPPYFSEANFPRWEEACLERHGLEYYMSFLNLSKDDYEVRRVARPSMHR